MTFKSIINPLAKIVKSDYMFDKFMFHKSMFNKLSVNRALVRSISINYRFLALLFVLSFCFAENTHANTGDNSVTQSSDLSANSIIKSQSMTLTKAKDLHYVGETFSGFIAPLTDKIPAKDIPQIQALVEQINQLRREKYTEIAKNNSLDSDMIARIAGEKLVMKETKNRYVKGLNGQWMPTK